MAYTQGVTTIANLSAILINALTTAGWTNVSGAYYRSPASASIQVQLVSATTSAFTFSTETVLGVSRTFYLPFGTNSSTTARVEYQTFIGTDYAVFVVRAPLPGTLNTSNTNIMQATFGVTTLTPYYDNVTFNYFDHVVAFGHISTSTALSNTTLYMRNGNTAEGWIPGSLSTMRVAAGAGYTAGIPDNVMTTLGSTQTTFWPYLFSANPGIAAPNGGGIVGRLNNVFFAGDNYEDSSDVQKPVNIRSVIGGSTYRSVIAFRNVSTATPLGQAGVGNIGGPIIMVKE